MISEYDFGVHPGAVMGLDDLEYRADMVYQNKGHNSSITRGTAAKHPGINEFPARDS